MTYYIPSRLIHLSHSTAHWCDYQMVVACPKLSMTEVTECSQQVPRNPVSLSRITARSSRLHSAINKQVVVVSSESKHSRYTWSIPHCLPRCVHSGVGERREVGVQRTTTDSKERAGYISNVAP